jgi:copper transport protein
MALVAACVGLVAGWFLVGVLGAAAASAHAELLGSTPADGQRLASAPTEVVLSFTEPVTVPDSGLGVLDRAGQRVDDGSVGHPAGRSDQVRIGLRPRLPAGAYLVTWRVVSADAHPIQGGVSFTVGDAAPLSAQDRTAIAGGSGTGQAGMLLAVARWAGFAGLALLVGGLVFLTVSWPDGRHEAAPSRLVRVGALGAAGAGLAEFLLQGPYAADRPVGDALDPALLEQTLGGRFGLVVLLRVILLIGLADAAPALLAGPARRATAVAVAAAVGLPVTWALAGHAAVGIQAPLAVAVDATHLAAMAVWLGGLVFLSAFGLRRATTGGDGGDGGDGRPMDLGQVLPRFSQLAFTAVIALAATGTYQSWRQVGTFAALPATTYGRLLLIKISLFCVLILLGNLARQFVQNHYQPRPLVWATPAPPAGPTGAAPAAGATSEPTRDPTRGELDRLRRSVGLEVLLAAAVLAVTAALVATAPARTAYARPFDATRALPNGDTARIGLTPARVGVNQLRVLLRDPSGTPHDVAEVTANLRLPARDLGPLPAELARTGPGSYTATETTIPFAGAWQLAVTVRVSEFDSYTVTADVPVH